MSKPEILPADVAAFAQIARKKIERSIRSRNADRDAFWSAVQLAYTRVPGEPEFPQDVMPWRTR